MPIESISAITIRTADMARAVGFYERLGFERLYGGPTADFTSFKVGAGFLNLEYSAGYTPWRNWGRAIFYVSDVDALYATALAAGLSPEFAPRDATWHERYFHILDPDGHELSFAKPLPPGTFERQVCPSARRIGPRVKGTLR